MKDNTITIRLNEEETAQLDRLKEFLGLKGQFGEDSSTIKACMNFTENVTHNLFGDRLSKLFYQRKTSKGSLENRSPEHN